MEAREEERAVSSQSLVELSRSGWIQITGASIGSGSNQEGKVRPDINVGSQCGSRLKIQSVSKYDTNARNYKIQISKFSDV